MADDRGAGFSGFCRDNCAILFFIILFLLLFFRRCDTDVI